MIKFDFVPTLWVIGFAVNSRYQPRSIAFMFGPLVITIRDFRR